MPERKGPRPLRVLFVTDHPPGGASSRWRIYQFLPAFEREGIECHVAPFTSEALYDLIHRPGHLASKVALATASTLRRLAQVLGCRKYDLVFIHREAFPFGPPFVELAFCRLARRSVFDFDDAIYAGPQNTGAMPNPWLYKLKYKRQIHRVMASADLVLSGNRILADYARRFTSKVLVVPTVLDTDYFSFREPSGNPSPVVIGWSGGPSTALYLKLLTEAFKVLKARYGPRINYLLIGAPARSLPGFDVGIHPFSLSTETSDLRPIDIGVMPLTDDEWSRGRCASKAVLYMAMGAPAVCSPVGIVPDLITHGEDGFLCRTTQDWVDKISALIDNTELRRRIARKARQKIEAEYSLRIWGPRVAQILKRAAAGEPVSGEYALEAERHPEPVQE